MVILCFGIPTPKRARDYRFVKLPSPCASPPPSSGSVSSISADFCHDLGEITGHDIFEMNGHDEVKYAYIPHFSSNLPRWWWQSPANRSPAKIPVNREKYREFCPQKVPGDPVNASNSL